MLVDKVSLAVFFPIIFTLPDNVAFVISNVALDVADVLLWFESPTTYACTYIFPTFVNVGFVVLQLPHVELFVLVL